MGFELRLVADSDLPDLQRIYEASPDVFRQLIGRPADPELAVRDFLDALRAPGRFQFGAFLDDALIGVVDYRVLIAVMAVVIAACAVVALLPGHAPPAEVLETA